MAAGLLTCPLVDAAPSPPPLARYVATVWQTEQGLPQNSVYDIVQDHDGYLWLATWGGLVRFDGVAFRVFGSADIPGLGSNRILSLHESPSGALWIGTRDGGLTRLDHGVATRFEGDGLPRTLVTSVREDAAGNVWVNSGGVVARVSGNRLDAYVSHRGRPVSEFYLQARDGSMWFRSGSDVVRFGADGSIAGVPILTESGILVHEARDGSVLIAPLDQGRLVRYHQGVFSDLQLPSTEGRQWDGIYSTTVVLAMATDTDGEMLLLTPAGFVRVVNGRLGPIESVPVPAAGLEVPKAISLVVDRQGNRWVGTFRTGLYRYRPAPVTAYGAAEGLSDSVFHVTMQDREGRIWLGGDTLHWSDGDRFHRFPGLADIRAITQTRDGDLWFGGSGGLYRWHAGRLSRFRIDAPAVTGIVEGRQGTLWIYALSYDRPGGLYRFREGTFEKLAGDVQKIADDRNGGVWLARSSGLEHVSGDGTVRYEQELSIISDMLQDPAGNLWIAEYGGRLIRFRDGRFTAITTRNGLPNDSLDGILADGRGDLWVSSDHGVFRFTLAQLADVADGRIASISPVTYGVAEGMRTSECDSGSPGAWKTTDGRIWFPTVHGVVAIDPAAGDRLPPPVVVEEARAKDLVIDQGGRASIPPGNGTFDFRYTALSLSAPEKVRFRYRLDPYDKAWVEAGSRRSAHFTNMGPGEYSFRVIAANEFGIWNEDGASVRFVLQPRYYQTAWFQAFCGVVLAALLWGTYRHRVRKLQRQFERTLNARVDERTRIARDLHDTLLQSAHGVLLSYQTASHLLPGQPDAAKERLDRAIAQTAEFITEARDQVQALRMSTSETNDLALALSTLGVDLPGGSGDRAPSFSVAVVGDARDLHPIVRDETYKIGAEALRNAFRHAGAKRIEVEVRYDPRQFRLRVRDDGRGIDPAVLAKRNGAGHFGLPGMRERAEAIGGELVVWSQPNEGTEVELRVPAGSAYATIGKRRWWLPYDGLGRRQDERGES